MLLLKCQLLNPIFRSIRCMDGKLFGYFPQSLEDIWLDSCWCLGVPHFPRAHALLGGGVGMKPICSRSVNLSSVGNEVYVGFSLPIVDESEAAAGIQLQAACVQSLDTSSCDFSDAAARQSTQSMFWRLWWQGSVCGRVTSWLERLSEASIQSVVGSSGGWW